MTFDYSDALLLEAIKLSQNNDEGATLTDIIKHADYINHALMDYSDFVTSTKKLKAIGVISERNKRLRTTDRFESWWTKKYGGKSRFGLLKAMEEIKRYLNRDFGALEYSWNRVTTKFQGIDFETSTAEYLSCADEILEGMKKKKTKGK